MQVQPPRIFPAALCIKNSKSLSPLSQIRNRTLELRQAFQDNEKATMEQHEKLSSNTDRSLTGLMRFSNVRGG